MTNLQNITQEAQREIEALKRWMPESFEIDDYQSPYELITINQAEGAYQTIKPLNVYPVGEIIPDDLKLYEYGSICTRWSPVDELGTSLEWVMQKDVSEACRTACIDYLYGSTDTINISSYFN